MAKRDIPKAKALDESGTGRGRPKDHAPNNRSIIVVGASAGGVEALRRIASDLPVDLPAAVFVVLHIGSTSYLPGILDRAGGGRKGIALPGDLRSPEFCAKLVQDAVAALGGLDILVSNAARQQTKASVLDITNDEFDATIKTNIYAPFWIIKAALPHLKPGSSIIGTTSEQATNPSAELYDYAQTKAATTSYVMSLAKQLGPKGIRVNGVAPGPVWTPLQVSGGATQEKLQKFGGMSALGRPGQPAELASIYVQLAATDASFTTGGIYGANGGGTVT